MAHGEVPLQSVYGSYKISTKLLYKMVSGRAYHNGRGAVASRYEIIAILFLTRIADTSGYVEHFRTAEFIEGTGCSRREAYALIHSLEEKGFISTAGSDWKCCRGVRILDNDFSSYDRSKKYLDTNHGFFLKGGVGHEEFMKLSVTAMKLLLFLMYNYSQSYGYHASYASIQEALGIKCRHVVNRCLEELSPLFMFDGRFYTVSEDIKRGRRYGFLNIAPKLRGFIPQKGVGEGQESFFKRSIRNLLKDEGCTADGYAEGADVCCF